MFTEPQYKVNKELFKFDAPFVGFALCCSGARPKVTFDVKSPSAKYSVGGIHCPVCDNQKHVIANGSDNLAQNVGFLYHHWNREFPNGPFYGLMEGFWPVQLNVSFLQYGREDFHRYDFAVMDWAGLASGVIRKIRLTTGEIATLEFTPKSNQGIHADFNSGMNLVSLTSFNYKWEKKLTEFLVD
jgi:hypothetical protein